MSDRWFENTFWNTLEIIQTNAAYATMHPLKQSTWGCICKHTAEISQTNATYVTMQLCKPKIGNLRAHLKIHRRYIVKQVLLYVALIPSCKHLCIRIDCKSEFIPMSAFFVCDIIELPWTDLNSHIWHYNSISSCLDLRGASKLPLAGILLSQMLHWILCPSCTVFTWKDKVAAVEKLELHCQHWQIRATPWALKTYHFVLHEFIDIQSCWFT